MGVVIIMPLSTPELAGELPPLDPSHVLAKLGPGDGSVRWDADGTLRNWSRSLRGLRDWSRWLHVRQVEVTKLTETKNGRRGGILVVRFMDGSFAGSLFDDFGVLLEHVQATIRLQEVPMLRLDGGGASQSE